MAANIEEEGHTFEEDIKAILLKKPKLQKRYRWPDPESDQLYNSNYVHPIRSEEDCAMTCANVEGVVCYRDTRGEDEENPAIYYGLIASAN